MLKDVFRSLMDDKIRSFFCWVTFTLTSLFIFLFFVVAMSDAVGVKMVEGTSDIPSVLMVVSVLMCSVEIVFANDFFIKNKSKELAVRSVCGSTYTQNALFLLLQTIVILVIALPVGIIVGLLILPLINQLLVSVLSSKIVITINAEALLWAFLVICYVVFWTLILNLSFSYRNSVSMLLNPNSIKVPHTSKIDIDLDKKGIIGKILHLILFLLPLYLCYQLPTFAILWVLVSLLGFIYVVNDFFTPLLERRIKNKISNEVTLLSLGYFRYDLTLLRLNILMYIFSSVLLSALFSQADDPAQHVLILITYVAMNALLSLSILFKYANEITERPKKFKTLSHLGFLKKTQKKIIRKEVGYLYFYIILITCFYLVFIFASLIHSGVLDVKYACILLCASILPLLICSFVTEIYYRKTVISIQK